MNKNMMLVAGIFLMGFGSGSLIEHHQANVRERALRVEADRAMSQLAASLTSKANQSLESQGQEIDALRSRADACDQAAKNGKDLDAFSAQQFTLLYEPGSYPPVESPGLAMLDAVQPGLGKVIGKLQSSNPPGASGVNSLRWVLQRRTGETFFRALVAPPGGRVVSSFNVPPGAK